MPWLRSCASSLPTCGSNVTTGRPSLRTGSDNVALLVRDFGYTRAKDRPAKRKKGDGAAAQADAAEAGAGADDWAVLVGNI